MLSWLETKLVYPAPRVSDGEWDRADLNFAEVNFSSDDGTRLHGWYFEHPAPRAHVVFCHGNAQHVAELGDWISELREHYEFSVLVYDYRGYGQSDGKPTESGVLADGMAAQRWLADRANINSHEVVLWGLSLGGAVAVHCAASMGARALILDRTFADIVEVAKSLFPWAPIRRLMRNRYPSDTWIKRYDGPLLQIHGPNDEIVPFEMGQALFAACPSDQKRFLTIDNFGHLDPPTPEFYTAVSEFVDALNSQSSR